jgi:hypothetical protein
MGIKRSSTSAVYIDFKKAYDSFRREDSYNVPIDIVIPMIW